jgi:hypothetical protein
MGERRTDEGKRRRHTPEQVVRKLRTGRDSLSRSLKRAPGVVVAFILGFGCGTIAEKLELEDKEQAR